MIGGLRVAVRCGWCFSTEGGVWMLPCGHYLCQYHADLDGCPIDADRARVEALGMEYAA